MIKINLLKSMANQGGASTSYFSSDEERKVLLNNFAKRAAILLIGPVALYLYEGQIIPELNNQLQAEQQVVVEVRAFNESKRGLSEEIKKYEQEQGKINAQMTFIDQVSKDKLNEYRLFQHLQKVTPETIWLNQLEFNGLNVSFTAETDVPADISKFMERLSRADFLINVSPVKQDIKNDAFGIGVSTTIFSIKAEINRAGIL